ncbi:MAG TPA: hypothetical protein VLT57_03060, partial [Bryobacteraceae bacterium]|nr:hypothetical protein [Bryobacteraceae bacterium]
MAVLLSAMMPFVSFAGNNSYKIRYDGGSLGDLKVGTDVKLYFDQHAISLTKSKTQVLQLPPSAILEISYGQDVHRRVGAAIGIGVVTLGVGALMALTKSKKHFIGITWDNQGNKGGFAFQADKNDYRGILAGLEGVTGKKAVDSETMKVK